MHQMQTEEANFPSLFQAVLLLLANFLLQYLVCVLLYDLRGTTGLSGPQNNAVGMVLSYGVLLVSVMHYRRMGYRDLFHSTKSSVAATLFLLVPPVVLLVPLAILIDDAAMAVVRAVLPLSRWEEQSFASMVDGSLPTVIADCLLAPVLEEMLFRGVLLRAFLARYPKWVAISYSALLFGVAHLNLYQFLLAFSLGLLFGWLFERSRSLLPSIAMHATFNTAVVVLEQTTNAQSDSLLSDVGMPVWVVSVLAAGVGATVLRRILVSPTPTMK